MAASLSGLLVSLGAGRRYVPPPPAQAGAGRPRHVELIRQIDATTCGAAVLTVLAARGGNLDSQAVHEPEIQRDFQRRATSVGARSAWPRPGGIPAWPRSLGLPPWGLARQARFGGVRYRHQVIDDATPRGRGALASLADWVRSGVPVPLYVGGDMRGGVARSVPRHVVLLSTVSGIGARTLWHVYEPSRGVVVELPESALFSGSPRAITARQAAFGGWWRIAWILIPE